MFVNPDCVTPSTLFTTVPDFITHVNISLLVKGVGLELTTLLWALVVADQRLLVGGMEQSGPVDGVVVAELAVVRDVHITGADLP